MGQIEQELALLWEFFLLTHSYLLDNFVYYSNKHQSDVLI